ncbi:MAG: hypothetical protein QW156_04580 [Candidatus Aenigmatarchaeota archaeon]
MFRIFTIESPPLPQNVTKSVTFSLKEGQKFHIKEFIARAIEDYKSISALMTINHVQIKIIDITRSQEWMNNLMYTNAFGERVYMLKPYTINYGDILQITFQTSLATNPTGVLYLIGELE